MIASAARRLIGAIPTPASTAGKDARTLAEGYLRYACASWRGDATAPIFGIRLGAYWQPLLPEAPAGAPHAFSPHGAGGRGIAWRQAGEMVIGSIAGSRGGYVVPVRAIPGLVCRVPAEVTRAYPGG
jgi:hypothetical protein